MSAYAVKHIEEDRGPLASIMKDVKKQPYSLTSKEPEAKDAARGNFVYVIEVQRSRGTTSYRLGYKYRARDYFKAAGGSLWAGRFKYKNSVRYGIPSDGIYFNEPVLIKNIDFVNWYKTETLGMTEIPMEHIDVLEDIFSEPSNNAKAFKI